ncbi:S8 family peptidase [Actinoalloteichus sp. GBA129-24]|uniref:S8 family peptidase n=1 Tax=Actinoalloteichus sp. GBA129-24 TaxID=1612551 RepID=UPI000950942E|nr:S8 family serine peptidase [Actinoalloteichus sp. GBA129-24]APU19646.1 subtilase family protease [Actinoalloteichus sp. GBA129-24]
MPLLSPAAAAVAGVALLAAGQLAAPLKMTPPADLRQPSCHDDGEAYRYLVLFEPGTPDDAAEAEIEAACGTTTVNYPEIGVAVAVSADDRFDTWFGPDRAFSAQRATATRATSTPSTRRGSQAAEQLGPDALPLDPEVRAEGWSLRQVRGDLAHRLDLGSADVLIGVLDSGIDGGHPALADAVDPGASAGCLSGAPDVSTAAWTPTNSAHGTHVAGIISSNGAGMTGVAPGVRLAAVRVVDEAGLIYPEYAVCGYLWAAEQGVDVTNNSYIIDPWHLDCEQEPGAQVATEAVRRAMGHATDAGVLAVAAAGNDAVDLLALTDRPSAGSSGRDCLPLPAGLSDVVTVSAVAADGTKARYSSYGLGVVDLAAPGGDRRHPAGIGPGRCVRSTVPGGYEDRCGTSMAAPHVAGVAALLVSQRPDASPAELRSVLRHQANPLSCPEEYDLNLDGTPDADCVGAKSYNSFYGAGLVDALRAVRN